MKKLVLFLLLCVSVGMNAQQITSVSPNVGNLGQTLSVTISGDDIEFGSISNAQSVSFYNSASENLIVNWAEANWSNNTLNVNLSIPSYASTGLYDVLVIDPWTGNQYLMENGFTVADNYNTISGTVTIDMNGGGCDINDARMAGIKVSLTGGPNPTFTFTDVDGNYFFNTTSGTYTVTVLPEFPHYSPSPPSSTVIFPTEAGIPEVRNFCLTPTGTVNDVEVTILPLTPARPGFDADYRIVYKNKGNQIANGTVSLTYDDSRLDLVSTSTAPSAQSTGNLTWNYSNFYPFQTAYVDVVLNVNSPMETPAVNNGDVLPFTAVITPTSGDAVPGDNTDYFNQVVVGSYDPNDKAVAQGSQIHVSEVGNYLHYLIRFQNTGTFAAENVMIRDYLASNLNKATLQVVSASHPYRTTLTEGNKLEFIFENINLPPESEDEPGSNGFVSFKIKPNAGAGLGTTFYNQAEIYFDFNYPIITNWVSTTVTQLANSTFDAATIRVYPNPTNDLINLQAEMGVDLRQIRILDLNGRVVLTKTVQGTAAELSIGHLNSGVYLLEAESDTGKQHFRVVKQ